MFNPTSTITVAGWMLQSVSKTKQKQRAQALTSKGNEHASELWGERNTENASFTLGGNYAANANMTLPQLGGGITDYTVTYSETEFPKLDVNKDDAAGGGTFTLPFSLPVRTIGCPTSIAGVATSIGACKTIAVAVSCQHVEETDGEGDYDPDTMSGMRDVTARITFTGVNGKPSVTMAAGWVCPDESEGNSNTAVGTGSVVYEKHFSIGSDTDASDYVAPAGT